MQRRQPGMGAVGQRGEIGQRGGVVRVIVDEEDLESGIGRLLEQAVDAVLHQGQAVARGNDERDEWRRGRQRVFDAPMVAWHRDELGLFAAPAEMVGQRAPGRLHRIVLLRKLQRGGAGDGPPVIQDPGNMQDLLRGQGFRRAQREVPVLAALVADTESARLPDELGAEDGQVRGVILSEEKIGQPVRLEVGFVAAAVLVDLVLVGVEIVHLGPRVAGRDDLKERGGRKLVVVVQEGDELPGGQGQGGIRRRRDVAVLRAEFHLDARIRALRLLQDRTQLRVGRAVVGDAELPAGVGLGPDRLDRPAQPALRGVVGRQEDRDHRLVDEDAGLVGLLAAAPPRWGGRRPRATARTR